MNEEQEYAPSAGERASADFWRQERRNDQFIRENRARYRWSLLNVSDPDDPHGAAFNEAHPLPATED